MQTKRPHSRLIEKEEKKAVRQSIFYVCLSILLVIGFLLYGLPLFFSLFLKIFGGGSVSQTNDFPPQVPVLSAPVNATSSANLPIIGYTEAQVEVIIVRNGSQIDSVTADDKGAFEVEVTLEKGTNTIAAFSKKDKLESDLSKEYNVVLDTEKPLLEVDEPKDGQEFESRANQTITIKGKTDKDAKVSINGRIVYPLSDGTFSSSFQLQEGENTIEFIALDAANNETKVERKVKFKL